MIFCSFATRECVVKCAEREIEEAKEKDFWTERVRERDKGTERETKLKREKDTERDSGTEREIEEKKNVKQTSKKKNGEKRRECP